MTTGTEIVEHNDAASASVSDAHWIVETVFIPEHSAREILIAALVFTATFLYLMPFLRFTVLNADEGIALQGAQRILNGQVLYRDFFGFYTPGSYYWNALIAWLFGNSFFVVRLMLVAEGAVLATLTYLLARRTCRVIVSVTTALLVSLASLPLSFYVQHSWDSSVLASLTVYSFVRLQERQSISRSTLLGFMLGLTALFEQSRGAGLLLGLVLACAFTRFQRTRFQFTRKAVTLVLIGFSVPLALTLLYFGSHGAAWTMLKDWMWPFGHYSLTNRLPYGYAPFAIGQYEEIVNTPLGWRLFFIFVGSSLFLLSAIPLFGIGILFSLRHRLARPSELRDHLTLVTCLVLGLWIMTVAGRRDYQHFAYLLPLSAVFLAWILDGVVVPKSFRFLRTMLAMWTLSSFALISFSMLLAASGAKDKIDTRRGALFSSGTDSVIPYIQSHLKAGDQLFVYPYQPLYYWLTETSNPTSYDYIQPGLHSREQVDIAIAELEKKPNGVVLLSPSFAEIISIPWPSTPERIIGAPDPMALYIVKHYRICGSLTSSINGNWTWLYMMRLQAACPHDR